MTEFGDGPDSTFDNIPLERESPNESSFRLDEKKIELPSGETVVLPYMHIDSMKLFHGSPRAGKSIHKEANDSTIGNGVYLTSNEDVAKGYALQRSAAVGGETPVVYGSEINDMNILSLTTHSAMTDFMKYFHSNLRKLNREFNEQATHEGWDSETRRKNGRWIKTPLEVLDNLDASRGIRLKDFLAPGGEAARHVLTKEGFDGLLAYEGGEYGTDPRTGETFHIGDHDSYVIFQPERVKILNENVVS